MTNKSLKALSIGAGGCVAVLKTTDTVTGNLSGTQTIDLTNAGGGSVPGKGDTTQMVSISAQQLTFAPLLGYFC